MERIASALLRAWPRAIPLAILCGLCLHVGRCSGAMQAERHYEGVIARIDTATAAAYAKRTDERDAALSENAGLRAKLEGVRRLTPVTRTVYDTLIQDIPVPVYEAVYFMKDGLTTDQLTPDSGGFRPSTDKYAFRNCDEGLSVVRGVVKCDPARLGHVTLFARIGASSDLANGIPDLGAVARAGIHFQPYYKSTFAVELYGDMQGRAHLVLRQGIRLW